jgi:hypothetical protein
LSGRFEVGVRRDGDPIPGGAKIKMTEVSDPANVWKKRFWILLLLWLTFEIAGSFLSVRGFLTRPLYLSDRGARGEVAYVMADGSAYWERLRAVSDLYHTHRVDEIYILKETWSDNFNFIRRRHDMRFQRAIDYLGLFGVPEDAIHLVPEKRGRLLSSRSEAEGMADERREFKSIVVVTSPPHTRRSKMCFQRAFGEDTEIFVYSACQPGYGAEKYFPIWIEYCKLIVYWFFA